MKLATREDVEVPVAAVFETLRDYDWFERAAMRRGAEVTRGGTAARPEWTVAFMFRGQRRVLTLREGAIEAPRRLVFSGVGNLFEGDMTIDLVELARRRTRIAIALEVRPLTLPARILLRSAQLARARIVRRMQSRTVQLAEVVTERWRAAQAAKTAQ
ncbi:MAG: SRPBCC family protein [Gemmobacter sp.]